MASDTLVTHNDVCQHFVKATVEVFESFCQMHLIASEDSSAELGEMPCDISAVIGFNGKAVGAMALRMDHTLALDLTERFFGELPTDINDDVIDCVGELANIIAGNATEVLESYDLRISIPSVIRGDFHIVKYPDGVRPQTVRFTTSDGSTRFEIVLALLQSAPTSRIPRPLVD